MTAVVSRRCSSASRPTPHERRWRHDHHDHDHPPAGAGLEVRRVGPADHATVPSRIAGERPTSGVPFTRLVHVELRKMLDTRAGRWLLIGIAGVIAVALTITFFDNGGQHPYGLYLQATTVPMALILPVVGILAVTSEWCQRTGLVTFGLEPRRARVGLGQDRGSAAHRGRRLRDLRSPSPASPTRPPSPSAASPPTGRSTASSSSAPAATCCSAWRRASPSACS